jgi:hypothetical protein
MTLFFTFHLTRRCSFYPQRKGQFGLLSQPPSGAAGEGVEEERKEGLLKSDNCFLVLLPWQAGHSGCWLVSLKRIIFSNPFPQSSHMNSYNGI